MTHATGRRPAIVLLGAAALALSACGGGGLPSEVDNPAAPAGQKLSFAYFQRCINPIFLAQLQVNQNGNISTNTCAGSGCHDSVSGTGGALRIVAGAQAVDLADAANTPDVIRAGDMYKNFYSAQGVTVPGSPTQSRLFAKPLLLGFLHGGGQVFASDQDPNAKLIAYWITHPVPEGQDEFSTSASALFTPPDVATGACNTQ